MSAENEPFFAPLRKNELTSDLGCKGCGQEKVEERGKKRERWALEGAPRASPKER